MKKIEKRVVILGGYGNFGKRIAESLSVLSGIKIIIAGRSIHKAQDMCQKLSLLGVDASLESAFIDIHTPEFIQTLRALSPDLVIHTGGPFQGQDYRVASACIGLGSHYIDLADDRRFVCDITSLHDQACAQNVLIVSGASSVPGLSSVVVDCFAQQFSTLEEIDFAIAPGNQAERGEATVNGILSYTGHPFLVLNKGKWINEYADKSVWFRPKSPENAH
ncbi:saccharopine dehydrogenase NADP-binding domain-containing protein [Nitrincola tibetensis]|uniref:saccharopine dehydrogenase NADP-binding domain-containing protein n=1 Tax=Nitrincola tibetensis TaxID=2219697 RepID=UPI001EFDAC75|nr:saccharopine dehydrogenase NADP-binding domain-containing protein [Nitrincola tibetensis]